MTPVEIMGILLAAIVLFTTGLFLLIARSNLIRMVIGIEFLGKGVSLLYILGGFLAGDTGTSQAVVFTLIAIEAVVAGLALAMVVLLRQSFDTIDIAVISQIRPGDEER